MKEATEKVFEDFLDRSLEAGHKGLLELERGGASKAEALRRDGGRARVSRHESQELRGRLTHGTKSM